MHIRKVQRGPAIVWSRYGQPDKYGIFTSSQRLNWRTDQVLRPVQDKSINALLIAALEFEAAQIVSRNTKVKLREMTFNKVPSRGKEFEEIKQTEAKLSETVFVLFQNKRNKSVIFSISKHTITWWSMKRFRGFKRLFSPVFQMVPIFLILQFTANVSTSESDINQLSIIKRRFSDHSQIKNNY